ncbi:hypothetical protein FNH09_20425 [Streptomyces adustus]|uniref:HTH cro/C1-type domain-containing protein n=1 Tax=Streptomyces adustus TaxID=1609272 RepID=A0A5N8VHH6_9ACTN|nr:hypothetical protein [Streptomyces adustus]MPY33528.1 hypothetical protein [Streptomyces adustus]
MPGNLVVRLQRAASMQETVWTLRTRSGQFGGCMARAGQRPGPLDAPTAEAERLALWLRQLTQQLTQRQLAERVGGGRTRWGLYLKGRVLIPYPTLKNLVAALVPPQHQHRTLHQGRELLDAAQASLGTASAAHAPALKDSHVLALQLQEVRKAHDKAQQALGCVLGSGVPVPT